MAGAGYKLFNTGDVLTAAQVNTYLMEQTVMVFDDATARTTALTGVVSEGMISYLKDTNAVEVYDGSNWVASDDPNAIQNSIVDAKGDLISATADNTPARIAVGNPGEILVADSSASTGLRWQSNFAAGKNALINGDFRIWQRGTSFSAVGYTADRWKVDWDGSGATRAISQQTFTPGAAPVAGYEGLYFYRFNQSVAGSGGTFNVIDQRIEDVRVFAGQTVTFSFWAKAAANTTMPSVIFQQYFGSGGSADVSTTVASNVAVTTSWQRFSYTFTAPSVSGKTIGTGSFAYVRFNVPLNVTFTLDFWGTQLEAGSVATAFQTATGTLAGERSACERYYCRFDAGSTNYNPISHVGQATATTTSNNTFQFPTTMRIAPTSVDGANLSVYGAGSGNTPGFAAVTAIALTRATVNMAELSSTSTGLTLGGIYRLQPDNAAGYVAFSAEL